VNPIEWLEHRVPGFNNLDEADRSAIFHFALLWSLFEAKALDTWGNAAAILKRVEERSAEGQLNLKPFEGVLKYFQERYFPDGKQSPHYPHLHLGKSDRPDLVERVLSGGKASPVEIVSAVLIVVYRLRNNLFHGTKWAYEIQDQRSNFENANVALIVAIEQLGKA
jgi:hypothetical protein